jgi:hypothetical protein
MSELIDRLKEHEAWLNHHGMDCMADDINDALREIQRLQGECIHSHAIHEAGTNGAAARLDGKSRDKNPYREWVEDEDPPTEAGCHLAWDLGWDAENNCQRIAEFEAQLTEKEGELAEARKDWESECNANGHLREEIAMLRYQLKVARKETA